jgi:polysaccharide biosynthesis transport protein
MPLRPNMELREYLELFLRRKWLIAASFVIVLGAAAAYCVLTPKQYKSSTTILVVPQRVPEAFVQSTVSVGIEGRLATIQQQILSRTRLMAIMNELGLFKEERRGTPIEAVVETMRERIEVDIIRSHRGRERNTEAFAISFVHEDPRMAQAVASRLASFFIDENLKAREQQAVGTSEFLETQLQETKAKLEIQEEKVKQYKMLYLGELPQQAHANLNTLTRLQDQARMNAEALRSAKDRKVLLAAQIGLQERSVQYPAAHEGGGGARQVRFPADPVTALRAELEAWRENLDGLLVRYTERYPEVIRVRQEVERLEQKLAEIEKAAPKEPKGGKTDKASLSPAGPAAPLSAEMRRLQAQVAATEAEIASLGGGANDIQEQIAFVQSRVDRLPSREQELVALTRDYENLKRKYDELLGKKLEADIAQNLEKRQKGEQFQIIDPANIPIKPIRPDIPKALGVALFLATAAGFGGVIGMEFLNPVLRGRRDFKHFFNKLPILGVTPLWEDPKPEKGLAVWRRKKEDGIGREEGSSLVVRDIGTSRFGQYMPLRARFEEQMGLLNWKVVAVTSAVASEGKTITCANLAMSFSAAGWKKVLLIDADLYKSDVSKGLNLGSAPGLTEYLTGKAALQDAVRNSVFPGLYVIPAGAQVGETAKLLGGGRFRSLLKAARDRFDIVLIDTPPVLSVEDPLSLRNEVDGFIFVYRAGYTPYTMLRQAVEEVGDMSVLGVVLNGVEQPKSRYYRRYYGDYGKYKAGKRAGAA